MIVKLFHPNLFYLIYEKISSLFKFVSQPSFLSTRKKSIGKKQNKKRQKNHQILEKNFDDSGKFIRNTFLALAFSHFQEVKHALCDLNNLFYLYFTNFSLLYCIQLLLALSVQCLSDKSIYKLEYTSLNILSA